MAKLKRAAESEEASSSSKVRKTDSKLDVKSSVLFRPAGTVGIVTEASIPFSLQQLGTEHFVTVATGNGFQVYDCDSLRLSFLSPTLSERVRGLLTIGETTITALRKDIVVWNKMEEIGRLVPGTGDSSDSGGATPARAHTLMCNMGGQFLVSSDGLGVYCWDLSKFALDRTLTLPAHCGKPTALCTVPTYLNKVLVGTDRGHLLLFNVVTGKLVHEFKTPVAVDHARGAGGAASGHRGAGAGSAAVTALAACPTVLDVVAVGFSSGAVLLLHAKQDKQLSCFFQDFGAVLSLSFRSDAGASAQLMSCGRAGFALWDLERRSLHHVESVSEFRVTQAIFLAGQPFLLLQGENALQMYVFDQPDGNPRLLRHRRGCRGPIRQLKLYSETGNEFMSCSELDGCGYLGKISTIQQQQNIDFSQNCLPKGERLPPISDISFSSTRHFDWPAVVTAHRNSPTARIWSAQLKALISKQLVRRKNTEDIAVTAVAVTHCGNWALVGYADGHLLKFSVQSQQQRESFERGNDVPAHFGAVSSVVATADLQIVSLSAREKFLRIWRLPKLSLHANQSLQHELELPADGLFLRNYGNLVVAALVDGSVALLSLLSSGAPPRLVRHFRNVGARILDISFSQPDGKWLAVSCLDGRLHIFDVAAARRIDVLRFSAAVLSMEFSPNGAYLYTTHPNTPRGAVYRWANRYLFDPSASAPLLQAENLNECEMLAEGGREGVVARVQRAAERARAADAAVDTLAEGAQLPVEEIVAVREGVAEDDMISDEQNDDSARFVRALDRCCAGASKRSAEMKEELLLTLSAVPHSQLSTILNLEEIKERNRVRTADKPTAKAPFFLPTTYESSQAKFMSAPDEDEGQVILSDEELDSAGGATKPAGAAKKSSHDYLAGFSLEKDNTDFFAVDVVTPAANSSPTSDHPAGATRTPSSKILTSGAAFAGANSLADSRLSPLQKLLRKPGDFLGVLEYLKKQTASGVHLALLEIGPLAGGDVGELERMLGFFEWALEKSSDADLVQAYLQVFLVKHQSDLVVGSAAFGSLERLEKKQRALWQSTENRLQKVICYTKMLAQTQTQW